eukprot:scaffold753_cov164-Ochromonas_danica.AAC.5
MGKGLLNRLCEGNPADREERIKGAQLREIILAAIESISYRLFSFLFVQRQQPTTTEAAVSDG